MELASLSARKRIYPSDCRNSITLLLLRLTVSISVSYTHLIDGEELSPEREDITLSHVDFSYDSKPILHDVSLTIPEKTTVAIVGPSGSGKTTLCNLMARFWDCLLYTSRCV